MTLKQRLRKETAKTSQHVRGEEGASAASSGRERREFFRIKDCIEIEFRPVESAELLKLERIIKYNPTQSLSHPPSDKIAGSITLESSDQSDPATLISYLGELNRKLSTIIDLLSKTNGDGVYTRRYTELEISGSGLCFLSDVHLPQHGYAAFRLILPISPYCKIPVLCYVVRSLKVEGSSAEEWDTACKFVAINDSDRDLLVQYIFGRERERIRSEKGL